MSDTIFRPSGLIIFSRVSALVDAGTAILALKSPVMTTVYGRNDSQIKYLGSFSNLPGIWGDL